MGGYAVSIVEENVCVRSFRELSKLNSVGSFQIWAKVTGDVSECCGWRKTRVSSL